MHNVSESEKDQPKDRAHDDSGLVEAILDEGLDLQEFKIQNVVRLGKKVNGKHRLMRVTLDSVRTKREALVKAKKLHDNESWARVFIPPPPTYLPRRDKEIKP